MTVVIVRDTLDWSNLNAIGREEAAALVDIIRLENVPFLLGHRVKSMIETGEYGGKEVGFFAYIAEELSKL